MVFKIGTLFLGLLAIKEIASECNLHPFPYTSCPMDDPLNLPEFEFFSSILDPFVHFRQGYVSDVHTVGGATYNRSHTIDIYSMTASFEYQIGSLESNFKYKTSGDIDGSPFSNSTLPSGTFFGNGDGKITVQNFRIKGSYSVYMTLTGHVQFPRLTLEIFNFDLITISLGNEFFVNYQRVDWETFSANLKASFDRDFLSQKEALETRLRLHLNEHQKNCTILEYFEEGVVVGSDYCVPFA